MKINPDPANKTPKTVIPIKNAVILHTSPDFDAYGGYYFAQRFGTAHFPGVDEAPMKFVDKSPQMADSQYDAAGVLPFDTGYGRFDHHRPNGRIPDSSTVKLVCEYMGVTDQAMLSIAEEIHWGDNNRGVTDTQIGGLIKSANRNSPSSRVTVYSEFVVPALDAIHKQLSWNFSSTNSEASALAFLEGMIQSGWIKTEKLQERMRRMFKASGERSEGAGQTGDSERTFLTEIDFIVRCFQRNGVEQKDIFTWLRTPVNMIKADEALFEKALDEVRGNPNKLSIDARMPDGDERIWGSFIRSDNPMILRAANFCQQDVVAIRNKRNQTQIMLSHKTGLTLDSLTAMIRWLEAPQDARQTLEWNDLMKDGIHEAAPNWYYERKRGQLFNGSLTHPGMKPTSIGAQGIVDAMNHAFHPKRIARWQSDRKITSKEQKELTMALVLP